MDSKSISNNVRLSVNYGHRPSTARRTRIISTLPQYNPDVEAEEVHQKHKKKLKFWMLFRYANWFDICLMIIGIIAAIFCAISLPWMILEHGFVIHKATEEERCAKFNRTNRTNNNNSAHDHDHNHDDHHHHAHGDNYVKWFSVNESIFVANFVSCFIFVGCFVFAAENQISRLRVAYFESLLRKDMSWLDNYVEREFGRHMTHDITQIRCGIGEKFCYIVYAFVVIILLLTMAFYQQWKISFIMVVLGPVAIGVGYLNSLAENLESNHTELSDANSSIIAEETLANIKTVKVFEGEEKEIGKYSIALQPKFGWKWVLIGATHGAASFFTFLTYSIIFYFGSDVVWRDLGNPKNCEKGHLELGNGPEQLFIVFFCILFASLHILEFPTLISQVSGAVEVASDVFFMIDWKPRIDNMSNDGDLPNGGLIGKIEFDRVDFRYPRKLGVTAIHQLSLVIYPFQVIAFVGSLGCGKSTILRLIMRLYDPTGGNVYIDGHNIENLNIRWLRTHIAIVSQEPVLFNKSIEENVRFAKWKATSGEVQQACKMAGIHDDIMQLKDGYDTIVGYHGNLLSTSQKRQLSFARAYLQKPKILLLDDPVAGCVPEFENLVLQAITIMRNRTTIVLSSSIVNSIVQNADRIYVMEHGTIVERGNHDYLMSLNGIYAEIKNSSTETNNKYISQLTSYRFAQSLRRMHLRKARAMREDQRKALDAQKGQTSESNPPDFHSRRVRTNRALILRVAGGLQRYHYTRTQMDPINNVRKNNKGAGKSQHEREMKQDAADGENQEEIAKQIRNQMQKNRESFSVQFDVRRQRTESVFSAAAELPGGRRASTDSEVVSIASDDSLMFWADYEEMLDNLQDVHEVISWKDAYKLGKLVPKYVIASILSSIFVGITPVWYGVLIADLFGTFTKYEKKEAALAKTLNFCIDLMALAFISGLFTFIQEFVFSYGGFKMMTDLRVKLFRHILKQDQEWFDKPENDISFLCARLTVDSSMVESVLLVSAGVISQISTTFLSSIIIAFVAIPHKLPVVYALLMGICTLLVVFIDGWFQREWDWITDIRMDDVSEIEIDVISNSRTVIALGLERHFLAEFKKELKKSEKKLIVANLLRSILFALAHALPFGFFNWIIYIFMTSFHVNDGHDRFADVLMLSELLIFGFVPLGTSLALLPNIKISFGAAHRINRIFKSKTRAEQLSNNLKPTKKDFESPPKIEMKSVEFKFNLNIEYSVLRDISFIALSKRTIAIVGPEGCGKSSVIQLLLRLYEPSAGIIKIDDEDIKKVDVQSIRKITSFVEQNPDIFDCTIHENIAYGNNSREVKKDEVVAAAKLAYVHDEIMKLPHEYETQISSVDSFQESSFGLRQRIVFARAILRDPKLLLIDEATASVDPESDFALLRALDSCCVGRTTIIASQRIEPIRTADLIIVLNNGYVTEAGSDRELLEAKGIYFNMYISQRETEGFSTNVEDLLENLDVISTNNQSSNENFDTRRRSAMADDANSRRRSSLDYQNYLKKRLTYLPQHSSEQSTIALYRTGTSSSINVKTNSNLTVIKNSSLTSRQNSSSSTKNNKPDKWP